MSRPLHPALVAHALRRIARLGALLCLATALPFLLSTCSGEVRLFDPAETPPDTIPSGVRKADLTLTVQVDPADEAVSEALGWAERAVPGADVTLSRIRSTEELAGVTDDAGRVTFERLLPGDYRASAVRLLTEAERGQLVPPDEDVNALGGGTIFTVEAPETEASLELAAGRPRSLVISEWSVESGMSSPGTWYDFGDFLELYNNTDTTIYLDGKLIGAGLRAAWDYPNWPCLLDEHLRNDTLGVWISKLFRFPGLGRNYPLAPGGTAVIATDAIDHGEYAQGMPDLSDADFEFIGDADVDNPRVPNLVSVGPRQCCLGHGLFYQALDDIAIVADPVDLDGVPREPRGSFEIWRIPAEKVLEVITWRTRWQASYPPCPRMVHERFDRQEARIIDPCYNFPCEPSSGQRPVLYVLPDGRPVLQHTRTSARDFYALRRTPGSLP